MLRRRWRLQFCPPLLVVPLVLGLANTWDSRLPQERYLSLLLLCGLFAVWACVVIAWSRRRGRLEVMTAQGRLWLPPLRGLALPVDLMQWGIVLAGVIAFWFGVVLGDEEWGGRRGGMVVVGFALMALPFAVGRLLGRFSGPQVGLGPDGIVHRGGLKEWEIAWDDLVRVARHLDGHMGINLEVLDRGLPQGCGALDCPDPAGDVNEDDDILFVRELLCVGHGSDPRLVGRLLQHYHWNPADRAELGTPAADERVVQGGLDPFDDTPWRDFCLSDPGACTSTCEARPAAPDPLDAVQPGASGIG